MSTKTVGKLSLSYIDKVVCEGATEPDVIVQALQDTVPTPYLPTKALREYKRLTSADKRFEFLYNEIFELMQDTAPAGCYFGDKPGCTHTLGFWRIDDEPGVQTPAVSEAPGDLTADKKPMPGTVTKTSKTLKALKECGCGCGRMITRKFAPGHDAKLKATLLRKAYEGDMAILEELKACDLHADWTRFYRPESKAAKKIARKA